MSNQFIKSVKSFLNISIGLGSFLAALSAIRVEHTRTVAILSLTFIFLLLISSYNDFNNDPDRKKYGYRSKKQMILNLLPAMFGLTFLFMVCACPELFKNYLN